MESMISSAARAKTELIEAKQQINMLESHSRRFASERESLYSQIESFKVSEFLWSVSNEIVEVFGSFWFSDFDCSNLCTNLRGIFTELFNCKSLDYTSDYTSFYFDVKTT